MACRGVSVCMCGCGCGSHMCGMHVCGGCVWCTCGRGMCVVHTRVGCICEHACGTHECVGEEGGWEAGVRCISPTPSRVPREMWGGHCADPALCPELECVGTCLVPGGWPRVVVFHQDWVWPGRSPCVGVRGWGPLLSTLTSDTTCDPAGGSQALGSGTRGYPHQPSFCR